MIKNSCSSKRIKEKEARLEKRQHKSGKYSELKEINNVIEQRLTKAGQGISTVSFHIIKRKVTVNKYVTNKL